MWISIIRVWTLSARWSRTYTFSDQRHNTGFWRIKSVI
jgi:hypothetical protein